jgi:non-specific serine/threonine protein kinase
MQLIGREHELAAVVDRLASRRVVTVVGPGGIGKTSLAVAVADSVESRYPLGAHLIDLTRVTAPGAVGGAIADQLGFPSFTSLLDSPADQPALLVVDNCEHVLDGAASAIGQLVEACATPSVLATSRSPLEIPGESLVVLGPLTMPGAGVVDPEVASVRLFLERARDAGVELGSDQLPYVAELCRAVDGLPLALEMAAARTRVMAPAEILARLGDLDTLARPRFRGADRHRSLRATIEWSYEQLNDHDRTFFDRLGVLAGRFDLGAAHAVASEPEHDVAATLRSIEALLNASLLVVDHADGVSRYHQLETLRTYALERLVARGEAGATWERFVGHVVDQAVAVMSRGRREWDAGVLGDLLRLYDDIAASLRWCIENDDDAGRALILLSVLWGVVQQGHAEDVSTLGEAVLQRWPDPATPLWADAAATVATCRYLLGRPGEAIELAEHALSFTGGSLFAPCTLRRVIG